MSKSDPHVLLKSALLALQQNELGKAAQLALMLLQQQPQSATAHHMMGVVRLRQGQDARDVLAAACNLDPRSGAIARHYGQALEQAGLPALALAQYDAAVALASADVEAQCLRSNVLLDLNRPEEALASCDLVLQTAPEHVGAWTNRGAALKALARIDEAIASFDRAIMLAPHDTGAHLGRGLARLLAGDYARGLPDYEYRHAVRLARTPVAGKTLLLTAEQGLGDTLQFCRYAQLAQGAGARVILAPQPLLLPLLHNLVPAVPLWNGNGKVPEHDLAVPLLSMPLVLATQAQNIPATVHYLRAEPQRTAAWREKLGPGFKIGLAWQGDRGRIDVGRSIPVEYFASLALPGVRLFSLQKGDGAQQGSGFFQTLPNLDSDGAFRDTAAVMMALDLVITSDTAIAHLAGALGRPVWLALQQVPDWRWGMLGQTTPWYPSMRLFRQNTRGDWKGVFTAMAAALHLQAG